PLCDEVHTCPGPDRSIIVELDVRFWGRSRAMKQPTLLRWIEATERSRFCLLADEGPVRAITDPINAPPSICVSRRYANSSAWPRRPVLSRFRGQQRAD